MKVKRKDKKPFKSGLIVNTVKEKVTHWKFNTPAYTFLEDDSSIEINKLDVLSDYEINLEEISNLKNIILPLIHSYKIDTIKNLDLFNDKFSFEINNFTAEFLFKLSDLLETRKVRVVAGTRIQGCNTCDHGWENLVKLEITLNQ